jgi:hypothetical protein
MEPSIQESARPLDLHVSQQVNAAQMRGLQWNRRYTLALLLVRSRLRQATDDVAEIFVRTMLKLDRDADTRLKASLGGLNTAWLSHCSTISQLCGASGASCTRMLRQAGSSALTCWMTARSSRRATSSLSGLTAHVITTVTGRLSLSLIWNP